MHHWCAYIFPGRKYWCTSTLKKQQYAFLVAERQRSEDQLDVMVAQKAYLRWKQKFYTKAEKEAQEREDRKLELLEAREKREKELHVIEKRILLLKEDKLKE